MGDYKLKEAYGSAFKAKRIDSIGLIRRKPKDKEEKGERRVRRSNKLAPQPLTLKGPVRTSPWKGGQARN